MSAPDQSQVIGALCQSCGMCCSGVIFDYLLLVPQERAMLGHGLKADPDKPDAARQPCPSLTAAGCSIYERRPGACRAYFCELVRRVETQEVSTEQAQAIVAETRKLADQVAAALPAEQTIADARTAWRTDPDGWRAGDPAGLARRGQLHLLLTALNRQLDTHFRIQDQQQTHFKLDDPQA